ELAHALPLPAARREGVVTGPDPLGRGLEQELDQRGRAHGLLGGCRRDGIREVHAGASTSSMVGEPRYSCLSVSWPVSSCASFILHCGREKFAGMWHRTREASRVSRDGGHTLRDHTSARSASASARLIKYMRSSTEKYWPASGACPASILTDMVVAPAAMAPAS